MLEAWFTPWYIMVLWLAKTIILTYALHQTLVLAFGVADDNLERIAGIGGFLYILGTSIESLGYGGSRRDMDMLLETVGVALLLWPRVARVVWHAKRPDPRAGRQ